MRVVLCPLCDKPLKLVKAGEKYDTLACGSHIRCFVLTPGAAAAAAADRDAVDDLIERAEKLRGEKGKS
jgi:hypothetical protein